MIYSVKWKESHMHTYKKHPRTCPVSMINNEKLFLFTVVFLPPFSLFFFLVFFSPSPFFESFFVLYTIVFAPFPPSTCESGVGSFSVPFRSSLNLLLLAVRLLVYCSGITSTVSWAAFNAARELTGQHLMRR